MTKCSIHQNPGLQRLRKRRAVSQRRKRSPFEPPVTTIIKPLHGLKQGVTPTAITTIRTSEETKEATTRMVTKTKVRSEFQLIHPSLVGIFPIRISEGQALPPGGKIKFFLKNWRVLTEDHKVLNIVRGWEIPFTSVLRQVRE